MGYSTDVIKYFCDVYYETYGTPYMPMWGRDGKLVKGKLLNNYNDDQIKGMIDVAVGEYKTKWYKPQFPRPNINILCGWLGNAALEIYEAGIKEQKELEERMNRDIEAELKKRIRRKNEQRYRGRVERCQQIYLGGKSMDMSNKCKFADKCSKKGTPECSPICQAFTFMHGAYGDKGLWTTRNVPQKYEDCSLENLPKLEPETTDTLVRKYGRLVVEKVQDGLGLFLYSKPTATNKFGTGNGKTTTAITLLNEYMVARAYQHLKGENRLTSKANPALFIKSSDFQNVYNSQFRGTKEMQEEASLKYYRLKERMLSVELLVIDDGVVTGRSK